MKEQMVGFGERDCCGGCCYHSWSLRRLISTPTFPGSCKYRKPRISVEAIMQSWVVKVQTVRNERTLMPALRGRDERKSEIECVYL